MQSSQREDAKAYSTFVLEWKRGTGKGARLKAGCEEKGTHALG